MNVGLLITLIFVIIEEVKIVNLSFTHNIDFCSDRRSQKSECRSTHNIDICHDVEPEDIKGLNKYLLV